MDIQQLIKKLLLRFCIMKMMLGKVKVLLLFVMLEIPIIKQQCCYWMQVSLCFNGGLKPFDITAL